MLDQGPDCLMKAELRDNKICSSYILFLVLEQNFGAKLSLNDRINKLLDTYAVQSYAI